MEIIFFDLDGTLSDPKLGITKSIQYALKRLNREVPPKNQLTWCIGPPLLGSFEIMLGCPDMAILGLKFYRERFSKKGLYENQLYPGILDMLDELKAKNLRLFVATSKPTVYAKRIIEHFNLGHYFCHIFGSELNGKYSDKSDLLKFALSEIVPPTKSFVMVGDRSHDIIGALNNDGISIGVLYGYGSKEELITAGANYIASTPEKLRETLICLTK